MKIIANNIAVLTNDTHISKWVEANSALNYDPVVINQIVPLLSEGDCIVEGGANIGTHTVAYAEKVGENGGVIAFDPNPDAVECLKHNCVKLKNVRIHEWALGDTRRMVQLHQEPNAGASYVFPGKNGKIECIPLDALHFSRLDFIKLDIEGFELFALRGAVLTLLKHRPKLLIEMNREALERNGHSYSQVFAFLRGARYDFTPLNPEWRLETDQYDLLALPI